MAPMMRLFGRLVANAVIPALLTACSISAPTPTRTSPAEEVPPATIQPSATPSETPVTTSPPISSPLPVASGTVPATPGVQVEDGLKILVGDGVDLAGTFYTPEQAAPPWPAVLLLHMAYGNRHDWGDFPQKLGAAGYAVLTIDLRGHGDSGGSRDWSKGPQDTAQAWEYLTRLPGVDPQHTAIIGASFGANLALIQGAAEESIRTVVLLSPGLSYFGVSSVGAMKDYGERPVLIVASSEDSYAAESSRQLKQMAKGPAELQMFDGAGHGIQMFAAQSDLTQQILDWLAQYLQGP
jgi:dipeptidyl aminopeptidase/acylaminoacyl peptidase